MQDPAFAPLSPPPPPPPPAPAPAPAPAPSLAATSDDPSPAAHVETDPRYVAAASYDPFSTSPASVIPPLHPPAPASTHSASPAPSASRAGSARLTSVPPFVPLPSLTMPSDLPQEVMMRILRISVEGASHLTRYKTLMSASLVARNWRAPAQELLCKHVVIHSQGNANRWLQSEASSRYPVSSLEVDGRYGQVDAHATESMLYKTRELESLRIDFVRGLSSRIFVLPNLAGLKKLIMHCKILCDATPLAIPFSLTHLTFGGSYFPLALTRAFFTTSSPTLRHLVLTLQTHHSPALRDLLLNCVSTLTSLESLTDWCRTSEDFLQLLPNLPASLVALNTCFPDRHRLNSLSRSLILPALPQLAVCRFMYLKVEDFTASPEGNALLASLAERGVVVEFGFERKDLREEHLLSRTEALRIYY
ncbi:hypothetical protein JCM21900_000413 [Sporobolomyces salmonicolor]